MANVMRFLLSLTILLTTLFTPAALAQIVNIDVGPVEQPFVGQGALEDSGNNIWNRVTDAGTNLIASDGVTPTSVSVSITTAGLFSYEGQNANGILNDYGFVTTFQPQNYISDIEFSGLVADEKYIIYVYSAGDNEGQGALIELGNAVTATSGVPSEQYIEGANYVVVEATADATGTITGTIRPYDSFSSAAINGFQIVQGELPTRVTAIDGAESPTVHSPGDVIQLNLTFSEEVELSEEGGLTLNLDIEGQAVEAVHVGSTIGTELAFQAVAPAVTTFSAKVAADSLQLVGAATLIDADAADVPMVNDMVELANDQISVDRLSVYPPVASLEPLASPYFSIRVREPGGPWLSPFSWVTKSIDFTPETQNIGYYNAFVGGWSHTYANFEMANNVEVEIEITKLDPDTGNQVDIEKAVAHPRRKVRSWHVEDGRAYVTIDKPLLVTVDIDGVFDDNPSPTSGSINENALHAVSVFANPFILDKPDINDTDSVFVVTPGTIPPEEGNWDTLYFAPGVHQIFDGDWEVNEDFQLHSNKSYYIPGNALVHGNFNNRDNDNDARNIRLFGHGTLSGERIPHFLAQGLVGGEENPDSKWNRAIRIANKARGSSVEGLTVVDPANHAIALVGGYSADVENYNYVRWTKVITWRANGDGISPNGSSYVEDSFMRTQDDGTYVRGLGVRRMTYWADVNGMPLRCSNMLNDNPAVYRLQGPLVVEDIDILYSRTRFGSGPGRSMIGFPDPAVPFVFNDASHVIMRDIHIADRFPTRSLFGWDMASGDGGSTGVSGVRFQNIRAASRNVDQELDPFLGTAAAPISSLVFDDVVVGGEHYNGLDDLTVNEFVSDLQFDNTEPQSVSYLNNSQYGKWYISNDWDLGIEPANNDTVNHTASGDVLTVDAIAYAGTLNVAHVDTATVSIKQNGGLNVSDAIIIGGAGTGELELVDGTLTLLGAPDTALSIVSGVLHVERGELLWTGDHVADLQSLADAGVITLGQGQDRPPTAASTLLATAGPDELYAEFDAVSGFTTLWVFRTAIDSDGDGVDDSLDNCLLVSNGGQMDTDGDGFGNACDADFNNDCAINFLDYSTLVQQFLSTDSELFDLNADGVVNFLDIVIFSDSFLGEPGPSAVNTVCL